MARISNGEMSFKLKRDRGTLEMFSVGITAGMHPHAKRTCPVCRARPEFTAHPGGVCSYGVRELALTLRDQPARDGGFREPNFNDLRGALRRWSTKQNYVVLVFFEYGKGASLRSGPHPHAHVLAVGWQCCVELGRMTWAEDHGNAHGGPWADIEDRQAVAELRVGYVSKMLNEHPLAHVSKKLHGHVKDGLRARHERYSERLDVWARVDPERRTGRLVQLV